MANVNVRLSDAEKEIWAKAAKVEGLNLSDWIRKRCTVDFTPRNSRERSLPLTVPPDAKPTMSAIQLANLDGITVAEATRRIAATKRMKGRVQ